MNTTVGLVLRGVAGAVLGGVVGGVVFVWLTRQGFYAAVLPGASLGLGCALLLNKPSNLAGILCALAAVPLGIFCEWKALPFNADDSLTFFLTNLHLLKKVTWIMIALGALFAYWLGKGRDDLVPQRPSGQETAGE